LHILSQSADHPGTQPGNAKVTFCAAISQIPDVVEQVFQPARGSGCPAPGYPGTILFIQKKVRNLPHGFGISK